LQSKNTSRSPSSALTHPAAAGHQSLTTNPGYVVVLGFYAFQATNRQTDKIIRQLKHEKSA